MNNAMRWLPTLFVKMLSGLAAFQVLTAITFGM
jgi:hypothetical protein